MTYQVYIPVIILLALTFFKFPIVGNGNSSEKELQASVLGCLNKSSLDKSLFHAAVNLIQCNMCGCI